MIAISRRHRQDISVLLIVSMLFSVWFVAMPNMAQASIWNTIKSVTKRVVVTGGALATGFMGGVLGAAVGGGPLGMALGAVAGYYIGNKFFGWTTKNATNLVTVLGAAAGGALCIGMGFPMIAAGVIGGGLVSLLAAKAFKKMFGKKDYQIEKSSMDPAAFGAESAAAARFINKVNSPASTVKPVAAEPVISDSQAAYNKYLAAYKDYMTCTQKGNAALAKTNYATYKKYLNLYNKLVKEGK